MVSKQVLVAASLIADALDMAVVGMIPGISWFIDLPVIAMHVAFAGPKGFMTIIELVPVVGLIPVFTIAAMSYGTKAVEHVPS
jgi:hypothetical protein